MRSSNPEAIRLCMKDVVPQYEFSQERRPMEAAARKAAASASAATETQVFPTRKRSLTVIN
jgi:hypothetical protein